MERIHQTLFAEVCTLDKQSALEFLRRNQPMPSQNELSQADIDEFDEVRRFFSAKPCNEAIPLFLNAFGEGDCSGVYQLVEDTLINHDRELVVKSLSKALTSEHRSIRYWSAHTAAVFPDLSLVEALSELIDDPDFDTREAAQLALEQCLQ